MCTVYLSDSDARDTQQSSSFYRAMDTCFPYQINLYILPKLLTTAHNIFITDNPSCHQPRHIIHQRTETAGTTCGTMCETHLQRSVSTQIRWYTNLTQTRRRVCCYNCMRLITNTFISEQRSNPSILRTTSTITCAPSQNRMYGSRSSSANLTRCYS